MSLGGEPEFKKVIAVPVFTPGRSPALNLVLRKSLPVKLVSKFNVKL